jgi:type IV secretory pathway VirB2 component (pilin)
VFDIAGGENHPQYFFVFLFLIITINAWWNNYKMKNLITFLSIFLISNAAFAQFSLCPIYELVGCGFGTAVATVAVMFLGIMAFYGKVNWVVASIVGLGLIIMISAPNIAHTLFGFSNPCICDYNWAPTGGGNPPPIN